MASYFNAVPMKGTDPLAMPELTGCCGGWLKLSYIISAPLHFKGFAEFWGSKAVGCANKLAVTFDLVFHLAFWVTPLIMEIWAAYLNKGGFWLKEVQAASMWALITALIGLLIAQVFAMLWGGQDAGRLFPSTYGLIVGGGYASIAFNCLYVVLATQSGWAAYTASDDDANDELAQLRKQTLWTIMLKFLAVTTAKQNAAFWGPCAPDVTEEQTKMLAESKGNGFTKGEPLYRSA